MRDSCALLGVSWTQYKRDFTLSGMSCLGRQVAYIETQLYYRRQPPKPPNTQRNTTIPCPHTRTRPPKPLSCPPTSSWTWCGLSFRCQSRKGWPPDPGSRRPNPSAALPRLGVAWLVLATPPRQHLPRSFTGEPGASQGAHPQKTGRVLVSPPPSASQPGPLQLG